MFRDGVAYAVVANYAHWDAFQQTAKNAWAQFGEIAAPEEIQKLSVRYINHFPTVTVNTLEDMLREPPTCPANLPLKEFVYQSRFDVPSYEFGVRIIKVLQPSRPGLPGASGLFLDLEAYTTKAIPNDPMKIAETLAHLRWLKNKVFFSLITESAIQTFS